MHAGIYIMRWNIVIQVQKKINELTGEIEFINKEEELFQWEISNYCEIEQVSWKG